MNNINDIVIQQAKQAPDSIAIIKDDAQISYSKLNNLIENCALFLHQNGIKEQHIVIHIFSDQLLVVIAMLASARLGATMISTAPEISKEFLDQIIDETKAQYIISDLKNNLEYQLKYIFLEQDFFEKPKVNSKYSPIYIKNPKAPWQIIIGSGSTGKKKIFPITHLQEINRSLLWTPITENDVVTSFTNMSYSSAKRRLFETFIAGASFLIVSSDQFILEFQKYHVTILQTTVFHIEQLLNNDPSDNLSVFNLLKALIVGGSSIHENLRNKIKQKLTHNLYTRYGSNETGTICYSNLNNVFTLPSVVGEPLKGIILEIVDSNGNIIPTAQTGFIRIKSPGMITGYFDDKEAMAKAFKDGWFYPGDIGKFTEDGQLIHLGRADDMMIMNGINIYPSQIENEMIKHPDVEEVFVVPLKHEIHQDIPICAVVLKKDVQITQQELMQYAYEHLASYRPQLIVILDETPRNRQGKVIKQDLMALVEKKIKEQEIENNKQLIKKMIIRLEKQFSVNLEKVDIWLNNILKIENEPYLTTLELNISQSEINSIQIVWRLLLLRKTFLQALSISISSSGSIVSIQEEKEYHAVETLISDIGDTMNHTLLELAMNVIKFFNTYEPNENEIHTLYAYLNKNLVDFTQKH